MSWKVKVHTATREQTTAMTMMRTATMTVEIDANGPLRVRDEFRITFLVCDRAAARLVNIY